MNWPLLVNEAAQWSAVGGVVALHYLDKRACDRRHDRTHKQMVEVFGMVGEVADTVHDLGVEVVAALIERMTA
jgi:hypothetical protein